MLCLHLQYTIWLCYLIILAHRKADLWTFVFLMYNFIYLTYLVFLELLEVFSYARGLLLKYFLSTVTIKHNYTLTVMSINIMNVFWCNIPECRLFFSNQSMQQIHHQVLFHHPLKRIQLMETLHHQYHNRFLPIIHFHHRHLAFHHIDLYT